MGLEINYLDGGSSLVKSNEKRKAYINAIQMADRHELEQLIMITFLSCKKMNHIYT
jgi:hypothetical protein